ncbi:hypothetical protein FWH13_02210 [Candidatus Saccharibacteria bacterium]|nr:hypothetical protein [Candidatus Saccharibacteria bacterium]
MNNLSSKLSNLLSKETRSRVNRVLATAAIIGLMTGIALTALLQPLTKRAYGYGGSTWQKSLNWHIYGVVGSITTMVWLFAIAVILVCVVFFAHQMLGKKRLGIALAIDVFVASTTTAIVTITGALYSVGSAMTTLGYLFDTRRFFDYDVTMLAGAIAACAAITAISLLVTPKLFQKLAPMNLF